MQKLTDQSATEYQKFIKPQWVITVLNVNLKNIQKVLYNWNSVVSSKDNYKTLLVKVNVYSVHSRYCKWKVFV